MDNATLHRVKDRIAPLMAPAVAIAVTAGCCVLAAIDPRLAVAGFCAAIIGLLVVSSPQFATPIALFLLYSNVTVVAVRFHRLPGVLNLAAPLLLAIPLVHALMIQRRRIVIHPVVPLLCLFLVVEVLGAMNARTPPIVTGEMLDFIMEGLLLFVLITNAVRDRKSLRMATWALLFAGCFISLVPAYQQLTHTHSNDYGGFGQTEAIGFRSGEVADASQNQQRAAATIGEQNRYAQNMLMLLPLGYFLFLREKSKRLRALALILTGGSGIGFLLTFSRGGLVAMAMVMVLMAFMKLFTRRHMMAFAAVGFLTLLALPQYLDRIASFAGLVNIESKEVARTAAPDGAIKGRVTEMLAAAMVFADYPLVGVGPGMFKYYSQEYGNRLGIRKLDEDRQAHCLYLDIAAENGALGLLCFMAIFLVTVYGLIRARAHHRGRAPAHAPEEDATPYLLAVLCYMATGLFLHLSFIRFLFVILALAAAAGRIEGPGGEDATIEPPTSVH